MRGCKLLITVLSLALLLNIAHAAFWFQFGAKGDSSSSYNGGASVQIQTITPQNIGNGDLGYWVGESLSNGAFIQAGYVVENESGSYPANCDVNGCTGTRDLTAGKAAWFYEYFLANASANSSFMGQIGPDGSAGANGTFNTYSFYSIGNTWYIEMNGKQLGQINLGTSSSGSNTPVGFGEVANTTVNTGIVPHVRFANLSVYKNGKFYPLEKAYGYVGYGTGSSYSLKNPYGVQEVGNRVNLFEVGSGLNQKTNNSALWSLAYILKVNSAYANLSSFAQYSAYSTVHLSAPKEVDFGNGTRATFEGWSGTGSISYTGSSQDTQVLMYSNITETANWETDYLINVTSEFGNATGSGWYVSGSAVNYGVDVTDIYVNGTTRYHFIGWSSGLTSSHASEKADSPQNITAIWKLQYLVNVTSPYGNTTGSGWQNANSTVLIKVDDIIINSTSTSRTAFVRWSNGIANSSFAFDASHPLAISAIFGKEFLTNFITTDANGYPISVQGLTIDGHATSNSLFLFADIKHNVQSAEFKGASLTVNSLVLADSPKSITLTLPIYNVSISTTDLFFMPVNASMELSFANGTTYNAYSGPSGSLLLSEVPYGKVNGTATYYLLREHLSAYGGGTVDMLFISQANLIAAGVILLFAIGFLLKRRFS